MPGCKCAAKTVACPLIETFGGSMRAQGALFDADEDNAVAVSSRAPSSKDRSTRRMICHTPGSCCIERRLPRQSGAGTRNRTATYCLEGSHSTVKPCPR